MKEINIITLTTDFGEQDYSVGALKGQLYSLVPEARIVDISHQVAHYSITEAAYLLQGAYRYFPQGTIHIMGVNNELSTERGLLLLVYEGQYFITADNGFIALFTGNKEGAEVYLLDLEDRRSIFPTLAFSTKIAQQLCQGTPAAALGTPYSEHLYISDFVPKVRTQRIEGNVIYIDHFGNVVSNITEALLREEAKGRRFNVYFRYQSVDNSSVEEICTQYNQKEDGLSAGNPFLVFNHLKYLEMAIDKANPKSFGGSASLMGIHIGDIVSIDFI
ncbi:SAM-dependent chlorinase/fluorinase [Capnocytophaga gingivalis]|uniref:SAM-dependent chlorinase/fluorinase n=1 Tax=Capnocytophaga gingivalis TaxID=1017 RepID=A0ABU5ZFR0_9FLAO|nr:SAM-dependent chlorinase/fluorinase [Capnocytophaga gingivalis]MEB3076386.1 SAM-dependent chlorinase/fluorinase [Capnocytophaga gingivalis]